MRSSVSHIHEEGFFCLIAFMLVDKFNCVIADCIGVIKLSGLVFRVCISGYRGVIACQSVGVIETATTLKGAIIPVKSALHGPVMFRCVLGCMSGNMPFAHRIIFVTSGFKYLSNGRCVLVQITFIACKRGFINHMTNARLMWI